MRPAIIPIQAHNFVLGAIVFGGINLSAEMLKSSLYSDTPCNDAIKEGVNQYIPAPPDLDPKKDEIIDQSIDWYIEEFNLPRMKEDSKK